MTWHHYASAIALLLFVGWCWCLCRAAARSAPMIKEGERRGDFEKH